MKRIYFIVALWCVSITIHAQKRGGTVELGSGRNASVEVTEVMGFPSDYLVVMDATANSIKSKFNEDVKVLCHIGYPLSMRVDEYVDVNDYFESISQLIKTTQANNGNYILFAGIKDKNSDQIQFKYFSEINNSAFSTDCKDQLELINSKVNRLLKEKPLTENTKIFYHVSETLKDLEGILDQGCGFSGQDEEQLYREKGYEIFDITGMYGNVLGNPTALSNQVKGANRSNCPTVFDRSACIFKLDGVEKSPEEALLSQTDYAQFPAKYIITSYRTNFFNLVVAAEITNEIENNPCDILFLIHIPSEFNGTQKLFIKTTVKENSSTFEEYKFDKLKEKFSNNHLFNDTKITFRFHDHPELWPLLTKTGDLLEAGFMAGVADGILRDLSFVGGFLAYIAESPLGMYGTYTIYKNLLEKQSYTNAMVEYELRNYMYEKILNDIKEDIKNFVANPTEPLTIFQESFVNLLKESYKNITFAKGTFQAGYTAGHSVYIGLSIYAGYCAFVKAGKGIIAFGKGVRKSFLEAGKLMKQGVTKEQLYLILVESKAFVIAKLTTIAELKAFLKTIDETTTIAQLEQKGIKSFFRGTTRSKADNTLFPGNPNSQAFGISTSTDPIKATIFSIESATNNSAYKGVLQIGLPNDLKNIALSAPNHRVALELEVVLNTPANNFANLSKVEISVENSRKLIKEVYGVDLPSKLSRSYADELLETMPESSLDKAFEFYKKTLQYNIK